MLNEMKLKVLLYKIVTNLLFSIDKLLNNEKKKQM